MVGRRILGAAVDAPVSLCLLLGPASAFGEEDQEPSEPRTISVLGPKGSRLIRAVTLAVREASRRLESARCGQIFADFADASGVRLFAKLRITGLERRESPRWLIFRNGSHEAYCDRSGAGLAADPGSRFVMVCGVRFVGIQAADPSYAAALVLHEELHVLGLGENPPSSADITRGVLDRCGR
jgi:hypothetical protein